MVCPKCLKGMLQEFPRRERPSVFFMIRAPRRCDHCGVIFEMPCRFSLCIFTILLGILMAVGAVIIELLPSIDVVWGRAVSFRQLMHIFLGSITAIAGIHIGYVGVRTAVFSARYQKTIMKNRERSSK
jgi:hypothetical protein